MDFSNDRDALLNYYQDLLVNNQISACKRRKLSDSDPGANDLLSEETRNREICKFILNNVNKYICSDIVYWLLGA